MGFQSKVHTGTNQNVKRKLNKRKEENYLSLVIVIASSE